MTSIEITSIYNYVILFYKSRTQHVAVTQLNANSNDYKYKLRYISPFYSWTNTYTPTEESMAAPVVTVEVATTAADELKRTFEQFWGPYASELEARDIQIKELSAKSKLFEGLLEDQTQLRRTYQTSFEGVKKTVAWLSDENDQHLDKIKALIKDKTQLETQLDEQEDTRKTYLARADALEAENYDLKRAAARHQVKMKSMRRNLRTAIFGTETGKRAISGYSSDSGKRRRLH